MKNIFYTSLAVGLALLGIQNAQAQTSAADNTAASKPKVLVVYFSHTGHTEEIANQIKNLTNADSFKIETVTPYPTDHDAVVEQARVEISEDFQPALQSKINNLEEYNTIFIGSPSWFSTIAPPVSTFLAQHDLTGKTVIPFVTHEGSYMGSSARAIAEKAVGANVIEGRAFRGRGVNSAQEEVSEWINSLNL